MEQTDVLIRRGPGGMVATNRGVMSPLSRGVTLLDRDQDVIRAAGDHVSTLPRTGMLTRGASWPLHPFLFGAAAVFSLYAANLRETTFGDVGAALGGVAGLALACKLYWQKFITMLGIKRKPADLREVRQDQG